MSTVVHVRRHPHESFPAPPVTYPLTFPDEPLIDLGAGLYVGALVTVSLGGDVVAEGVVTQLDAVWITVEVPEP